jgi:hypothetical protein
LIDRNVPRKARLQNGVKGHNMKETSFAHILFATGVSGKPRPVGGKLHLLGAKTISVQEKNQDDD